MSLLISSFPNKMVLGRTHIKEVAAKRKLELNNYVHNLMRSSTEVTQVHTHTHTDSQWVNVKCSVPVNEVISCSLVLV